MGPVLKELQPSEEGERDKWSGSLCLRLAVMNRDVKMPFTIFPGNGGNLYKSVAGVLYQGI